jgi:uncharacterized protein DUF3352
MRRAVALILALAAGAAAGCGGGDSGSALDSTLAFLPKDTTFAVAVDTNVDGDQYKALAKLLNKFPFGNQVRDNLLGQLEQSSGGVNYNDDVKPVLGNPLVVGAGDPQALSGNSNAFIVALKAKDKGKLEDLVDKMKPRKTGEASGATLYRDSDTSFAVKDDMVVLANDDALLKQALERADGDDHFGEDAFDQGLNGLPDNALARVYTDVEALLKNDPNSADARRIRWVAALRELGLTVTARDDGLDVDFRVRTEGDLSDEDLPIASGDEAPPVIRRPGEIGVGIRDLAHIVHFGENAGQSVDPSGFGDYEQAKKTIDKQLGVSLDNDLIAQLTGNVSATVALGGGFGLRADLKDPKEFKRTLTKIANVLPSFAQGAGAGPVKLTKPKGERGFYSLKRADGSEVDFAVVGDVLVVASDRRRAALLAREQPVDVPGASGSVTISTNAEQLVNNLLKQFGAAFGLNDLGALGTGLFTRPLGDPNGHISASPDELRGKFSLAVE